MPVRSAGGPRFESGRVRLPRTRTRASWHRDDSLLVLAAYFERPSRSRIPPETERQRLANVTRHLLPDVTRRFWMFAGLDPANPSAGVPAGLRERRLWKRYHDDRLACMLAADRVMESRRRLPPALRRR